VFRTIAVLALAGLLAGCSGGMAPVAEPAPDESTPAAESSTTEAQETYSGPVRGVVVDTDMSIDDLLAIAMLVQSPRVDVQGIAITGLFVRCPTGERIMLDFLATIGATGIPVACGATEALESGRTFPDDWRDFVDRAWEGSLTRSTETADPAGGVALIERALSQGADTLVILGPPTSSALALRANPDLVDGLVEVVMMAGAVDVPGNVYLDGYENPAWPGEWNVYVDPHATAEIFASGAAVVMVGLDATNTVPVTRDAVERMRSEGRGPAIDLAVETLERHRLVDAFDSYFWDQLAAAYVLNASVVTLEQATISVAFAPEREAGRTSRDPGGSPISIATGADASLFYRVMIESLSGRAG